MMADFHSCTNEVNVSCVVRLPEQGVSGVLSLEWRLLGFVSNESFQKGSYVNCVL